MRGESRRIDRHKWPTESIVNWWRHYSSRSGQNMLNQRGVERTEKRKNGNEYTCRYNRFIHCPSACGASTSDSTKDDMLLDEASRSYLSASIHCIQISRDQSPSITSVPIRQRGKSCDREESQYAWTNFEIPAWVRNKASLCKTSWFPFVTHNSLCSHDLPAISNIVALRCSALGVQPLSRGYYSEKPWASVKSVDGTPVLM